MLTHLVLITSLLLSQYRACVNSDNGNVNTFGDGCASYNNSPHKCGFFTTRDFNSETMCCGCGGGTQYGESRESSASACVDSDNGNVNTFGDGCWSYNDSPHSCGFFTTSNFNSETMCCGCGGGNQGGSSGNGAGYNGAR